jgi:hypothetical protein
MKKLDVEFNIITGIETITERDETKAEAAERVAHEIALIDDAKAETDRATAKAALLARLGITPDEAKLLLG